MSLKPVRSGCGNAAAISSIGASPRNRYMGFFNELPPVSSMASSAPSCSSRRAAAMLSLSQMPPRYPSIMLSFASTAMESPTAARNLAHDLARELGAVLDAAAPPVGALVQRRAEERARQVVVPEVHLDRVEPGFLEQRGGASEVGGDPGNVGVGDRLGEFHGDRAELTRRCEALVPRARRHRSGVADLRRDRGAFSVDRVGQPAQPRHRLGPHDDLGRCALAVG